ncbi:unnamed protein product, partial [Commensalibacter communis]
MTVGTITTGEPGTKVIVENVGTSSDVILNFTIPKGDKGDQGEQGIQGEKGDKGDQGESYTNDGTVDLNIKSLQLGDIQTIDISDVPDGRIFIDRKNN